ncbi:mannose-6-phosphate isomerase, class I [Neolewinella persica]|uniref:mannose-6-phosphate isomerase, class I n=1 Tax=Neolewinella persica TaxID=70998 RepID=UPI00039DB7EB|nr:mannose-6-phosphate isomerase, class I [Neolewinella persica]
MASPPQPFLISGVLQHYDWGGYDYIASLLGRQNPDRKPTAELWLGAHPKGAAQIIDSPLNLAEAIAADPEGMLGEDVAKRFNNQLPFLFKVLDVREMLSIQVHPTKAAAETGFAREEAAGIDRMAPNRNYRDDNHKPELGVALTDFYLLHGFKSKKDIQRLLRVIPGWDVLIPILRKQGVAGLYEHVMSADQQTVNELAQGAVDSLGPKSEDGKEGLAYWTHRAIEKYSKGKYHDRGIFSIWWMNIVHLHPGEAIFQDAGIPHAYLEGVCLEVMANSDNVLRGGLTPKYIDVEELLAHTVTRPVKPALLLPNISTDNWERYPTPSPDFALYRAALRIGEDLEIDTTEGGPLILFLLEGKLVSPSITLTKRRRAAFIPAGQIINFLAYEKGTVVYRAGIGVRDASTLTGSVGGHHISDR